MRLGARLLAAAGSLTALLWGAVCAAVYWRAFGHRNRNEDEVRVWTPSDFGVPHEALDVRTSDGLRLSAWYLPGRLAAAVVVSGGYRGRPGDVLGISAALQRAGFHVVVYGWRGTPGSDPAMHTLGVHERSDLLAVLDALSTRLGDLPIGLLGYSMGGAVSISVGATDGRVRAVCSDSAFGDPRVLLGSRVRSIIRLPPALIVGPVLAVLAYRSGARFSDFSPVASISAIAPRPVLIIHGDADRGVPVEHAHLLYEAAGEPRELWVIAGAGHVGAYFTHREEYVARVCGFFEAALVKTEVHTKV